MAGLLGDGAERRAWLNRQGAALQENIEHYVPPHLRGLLRFALEMNPVRGIERASQASMRMDDPGLTPLQRAGHVAEMLAEVAAVAGPAAIASRIGMAPVQAVTEGLLGYGMGTAPGQAADALAYRLGQPSELAADTLYANPIPWEMRIDLSTPNKWRDPKYAKPQWHPISDVAMATPAEDIPMVVRHTDTLEPPKPLRIEDLQGRILTPAYGDRTIAGVDVLGVGDTVFENPVRSLGGNDFMREAGTGLWASEEKIMGRKAKTIRGLLDAGEDPALVYTAMGAQSGDFSTMMRDVMLNMLEPEKISQAAADAFDAKVVKEGVKNWPGIKSPEALVALQNMPGTQRWIIWQEMDKSNLLKGGFPDIASGRLAITDPRLRDVTPFSTGLNVGRPDRVFSDTAFDAHPSYPWQIGGAYEGELPIVPGQIIWRDFFERRRAEGLPVGTDAKSFMGQSPEMVQRVDQQMVDEVNEYLQGLLD